MDSLEPEQLDQLTLHYELRRAPEYEQEAYPHREVISIYREELDHAYLLFPAVGVTCLERLNRLSQAGHVLITADKGEHILENLMMREPPELILHGSFSLTANYHAIQQIFGQRGTMVLFPPHHYRNINVGCILYVDKPKDYLHMRLAYRRCIERFGPDEFYSMKTWVDRNIDSMGLQQLLSFWRLGRYDAEFFIQSTERIASLLPEASDEEKQDLLRGIQLMWSSYYVMEQRYDLALDAGLLLLEMNRFKSSKYYLEISIHEKQDETAPIVLYCLAICCFELELFEEAKRHMQKFLELEPDHQEALALMSQLGWDN